jgi:ElaB/YqjD/DUF883 family membrane-anchored ribosome-binding protein
MTRSKPELGYTPRASRGHFMGGAPNSTPPGPQRLLLRKRDTGARLNQQKESTMEAAEHGDREKNELRARLEAATEKAKEVCKRLQEETVAAAKATDKAVREHPYQAAGIAFGVGLLIGVLATRCRRD